MRTRRVLVAGAAALAVVGTTVATSPAANAATNVYEAESAANSLSGVATVMNCGGCSNGKGVGFAGNAAGSLRFNGVGLGTAGRADLAVSYTGTGASQAQLSVNGGPPVGLKFAGVDAATGIGSLAVPVTLNASGNTLSFTNAGGPAPGIDAISVSAGAGAPGAGLAGPGAGTAGATAPAGAAGAGGPTAAQLLAKATACKPVSNGSYASEGSSGSVPVCAANGAVYWRSGMAIDCDGQRSVQCNESTDCCYANATAFRQSDGQPLNSAGLPYLVVPGSSGIWNYSASGVLPGSVAAVIHNDQVAYAVVGDVGPTQMIGEGSYALAQSLGINPNPRVGGAGSGVTFIVFTGTDAVVRPIEDHASAVALGERLARQFIASN